MTTAAKRSEVDLLKPIVAGLQTKGWDVTQEPPIAVSVRLTWHPDIVAVQGDQIRIFEGKVIDGSESMYTEVIEQAERWRPYAHEVFIVCPHPGHCANGRHIDFMRRVRVACLGLVYVTLDNRIKMPINPIWHPSPNIDPICLALSSPLKPQEAGTPSPAGFRGGKLWSDWRDVRQYVGNNPGESAVMVANVLNFDRRRLNALQRMISRNELHQIGLRGEQVLGKTMLHIEDDGTLESD